jgi:uncharacterized protein (TIGR03435 family)
MPPPLRALRRAEIDSDLWESQRHAGRGSSRDAFHILLRLLLGVPDDLGWRLEQATRTGIVTQRGIELTGRAAGAALFIFILSVMDADASRRRATHFVATSAAGVGEQRGEHMSKQMGGLMAGLAATFGVFILPPVAAQSPPLPMDGPAFEVASVRRNMSGDARTTLAPQPGGRLTAINATPGMLIRFAYDLPPFQVSGGPDWLDTERFDVNATTEGDPSVEQKQLMLRRLLAERFKVRTHTETRELPIYALVMARSDRRLGPQLRPAAADCARVDQQAPESGIALGATDGPSCGFFGLSPKSELASGRAGLAFRGLTMAALAKRFVPILQRSVIDRTGLAGHFDAEFEMIAELPLPPPPPGAPNPFDAPFASVFTVLPQQLGLRLESGKGPVDVLVIDTVERPAPE